MRAIDTAMMHPKVAEVYTADQADRMNDDINCEQRVLRDEARRTAIRELLETDTLASADDYCAAAFAFQHGQDSADYQQARDLAQKAFEIDPTLTEAKWLVAATTDCLLMAEGKPQIYGTQLRRDLPDGLWTMEPFDEAAVSESERSAHQVDLKSIRQTMIKCNEELKALK